MRWRDMDRVRRVVLVVYVAAVVVLAVIILTHLLGDRRGVSWATFALPASYLAWLAFDLLYRRRQTKREISEGANER